MADVTLVVEKRNAAGKGPAGRVRRQGLVPAVVYGLGGDSVPVTASARELGHILSSGSGANTLITLELDGSSQLALARQIQRHPVKGTLVHVDFIRVRADQTIQAEIPVHLTGEAEGAARGGVLEQLVFTLSIEALPGNLPPAIELDVTTLEIGDGAYVRDLAIPEGVTVLQNADELVAQVSAPRVAEEVEPAEGEVVEGVEGVEAAAPAPEGESTGSE